MFLRMIIAGVAALSIVFGCVAKADTLGTHEARRPDLTVGIQGVGLDSGRGQVRRTSYGVNGPGTATAGSLPAGVYAPTTSSAFFNGSDNFLSSPSAFLLNDRVSPATGIRVYEEISLGSHGSKEASPETRSHDTPIITSVIPEPGSLALFGTGLVALAGLLRRKANR
jgi:hypothetical protein